MARPKGTKKPKPRPGARKPKEPKPIKPKKVNPKDFPVIGKAVIRSSDKAYADSILREVKEVGILSVYKRFYQYYRVRLKERFSYGSISTPYASTSLGKKRKSGDRITRLSLFNQDTLALYESVTEHVKLNESYMEIKSDVFYAPFALKHFEKKGGLAPEGLFRLQHQDIDVLETYLIEEYLEVFK